MRSTFTLIFLAISWFAAQADVPQDCRPIIGHKSKKQVSVGTNFDGIEGNIFYYNGEGGSDRALFSGDYIHVTGFTSTVSKQHGPLFKDQRALELIKSLLSTVPILITDNVYFAGAVPMPTNGRTLVNINKCFFDRQVHLPFMILSPTADYYTIKHELVHYEDVKTGFFDEISKDLSQLWELSVLSNEEISKIRMFIVEHRAYFLEHQTLIEDLKSNTLVSTGGEKSTTDEAGNLKGRMIYHSGVVDIRQILRKLALTSQTDALIMVSQIIKSNCPNEGPVGVTELLPELLQSNSLIK